MSRDLSMSHDLSVSAHDLTVLHTICGVMHNVSVLLVGLHILNSRSHMSAAVRLGRSTQCVAWSVRCSAR